MMLFTTNYVSKRYLQAIYYKQSSAQQKSQWLSIELQNRNMLANGDYVAIYS